MRLIDKLLKINEKKNKRINKIHKSVKKTKKRLTVGDLIIVLGMAYALNQSERNKKRRAVEAVKKFNASKQYTNQHKNVR